MYNNDLLLTGGKDGSTAGEDWLYPYLAGLQGGGAATYISNCLKDLRGKVKGLPMT
jgi:hypothetical protein